LLGLPISTTHGGPHTLSAAENLTNTALGGATSGQCGSNQKRSALTLDPATGEPLKR
jgi:hypothetical protein